MNGDLKPRRNLNLKRRGIFGCPISFMGCLWYNLFHYGRDSIVYFFTRGIVLTH